MVSLVRLAAAPVVATRRSQPSVQTAPQGPRSRIVVYQSILSGSIGRPSKSQTTLCPAKRPIGRPCWHDITQEWLPSIANQAASPVANSAGIPLTLRKGSTGTRPNRSRSTGKSARQRMRLHPGAPDDCRGGDALARGQGGAGFVDRGDRDAGPGLDAERRERLVDYGARLLAHIGADPRLPVGNDHARRARRTPEGRAQFPRHLGRDLDAGQAAADDQRGPLPRRWRSRRQRRDMGVEPAAGVVGVDIEGVRVEARDRRAGEPAAEGEDQPVIGQETRRVRSRTCDLPVCEVDAGYLGLNALDADRPQNLIERNPCCVEIGLVVAHADRMPCAAVDERDLDPVGADAELIELASGADRGPQAGKASPQDDDLLH